MHSPCCGTKHHSHDYFDIRYQKQYRLASLSVRLLQHIFVGGTSGAEGTFETDYWLTCYKEALEEFENFSKGEETLIVYREAVNAAYYASDRIEVIGYRPFKAGDYLLLSARLNEVHNVKRHSPNIIEIGRDGATFCAIREIAP